MTDFVKPDPSRAFSGFGDPLAADLTPRAQIDAVYGVVSSDVETITVGGSVSETDATFVLSSGAGANNYAALRSRRVCRYRPGQAGRFRFTASFSPTSDPAAIQIAGAFTSTDGLLVMQLGGVLGVCRRIPGTMAVHRLTLTNGAAGAETVTVTLDGVAFPVATGGALTTEALARLLAAQTYAGWTSAVSPTANGSTVTWLQALPAATPGAFSFASTGTATGTFATLAAGAPNSYDDFRPQSAWNLDTLDGSGGLRNPSQARIDPTGLNVYEIDHTHLGAGPIVWRVLGPQGRWIDVHREVFFGTRQIATQKNPTYRVGWAAARGSTSEAVTVRGASAAAFVCGQTSIPLRNPFATGVINFTASTTPHVALALRVRSEFASRANQREVFLELLAVSTETSNRAIRVDAWLNPTPSAALAWGYVDQSFSAVEAATPSPGVTISGGRRLTSVPVATGSGTQIRLDELDLRLDAGDVIVFTLQAAANTAVCVLSVTHRED